MEFPVVDATPIIRESLCYVLLSLGVKGIQASSAKEATQIVATNPDTAAAIIDVDSTEIQGPKLIQELKADEKTSRIKIIVHTIQSNKEFVVKMIESGVVPFRSIAYNSCVISFSD